MMPYVTGEREGEFPLHLDVCKRMLPYFFAACNWNYARDGIAYVQMMENFPGNVLNRLMKGEHVLWLLDGLWNAIWMDMTIESIYMSMGKGLSRLIGVTTRERTAKVWVNDHHLCRDLLSELNTLRNSENVGTTRHKEEEDRRIKSNQLDRKMLQNTWEKCIHPLSVDTHNNLRTLVNIYTGEEDGEHVNVSKAVEIEQKQMVQFCGSLPQGFRKRLSTKVVTMADSKKTKMKSVVAPFNTNLSSLVSFNCWGRTNSISQHSLTMSCLL